MNVTMVSLILCFIEDIKSSNENGEDWLMIYDNFMVEDSRWWESI